MQAWCRYAHGDPEINSVLLNAMFHGEQPQLDHRRLPWDGTSFESERAGAKIAVGIFCCLVVDRGLTVFMRGVWFITFKSVKFCWMCGADRADHPYTDVSSRATWRSSLLPFDVGDARKVGDHPIWDLTGVTRWHAAGDLMHTGDLGVLLWLLGAVLWELVFDGPFRGPIEARRKAVWNVIESNYDWWGFLLLNV